MEILFAAVVAGIGLGSVYALISVGYTVILASSSVFNLAQGAVVMGGVLGMYLLWQVWHWTLLTVVIFLAVAGAVIGGAAYVISVRPLFLRRAASAHLTENALVTTFGVSIALVAIATKLFGPTAVPVSSYIEESPILVGEMPIRPIYLIMLASGIVVFAIFEIVLRRSLLGLRLRAAVDDIEGAQLLGISVPRIMLGAFAIAGALAGIAGLLVAPITSASPRVADELALYGFVGMAIGGFGSFNGALVGGVVVGLLSNLGAAYLPSTTLVSTLLYLAMVLMLLLKPTGLFGRAGSFGAARLREV